MEIKCPFLCKTASLNDYAANKKTCLHMSENGLELNKSHSYYYQVQAQLFICDVGYCDFVVCAFAEQGGMFQQRVMKDDSIWQKCIGGAKLFFELCVLPELLGKYYTRPRPIEQSASQLQKDLPNFVSSGAVLNDGASAASSSGKVASTYPFCYCKQNLHGVKMIRCEHELCSVQWVHYTCAGITRKPRCKWYCAYCDKLVAKRGRKRKVL